MRGLGVGYCFIEILLPGGEGARRADEGLPPRQSVVERCLLRVFERDAGVDRIEHAGENALVAARWMRGDECLDLLARICVAEIRRCAGDAAEGCGRALLDVGPTRLQRG